MDSNTSSDNINLNNINYIDNDGNNIDKSVNILKQNSESTDLYLNSLANQNKILEESEKSTSSLQIQNSEKNTSESSNSSKSSSSKPNFEEVTFNKKTNNSTKIASNTNSNTNSEKSYTKISSKRNSTPIKDKPPSLSPQEVKMKKIELLRKLSELKQKGYKLTKDYDFNSSLEDMEYEYDLLKSFANKRNGVKLYKNILLNACSVTEFMNDKYDPFSFQLSGWSEHMSVEVDSYDDVLEELYEKYKGKGGSMPPEVKLLLLVLASASAFHFSKSHLSNLPGIDKVLQNNPDLISNVIAGKKKSSQFMTEQEIHLEKLKQDLQNREKQLKQQQFNQAKMQQELFQQQQQQQQHNQQQQQQQQNQQQQSQKTKPLQPSQKQQFDNSNIKMENYQNAHHPVNLNTGHQNNFIQNNDSRELPKIEPNETVRDILSKLHSREPVLTGTDTQEESSNTRLVSDMSLSESKKKSRKKKSIMQIN